MTGLNNNNNNNNIATGQLTTAIAGWKVSNDTGSDCPVDCTIQPQRPSTLILLHTNPIMLKNEVRDHGKALDIWASPLTTVQ